jgi:hypothetical protein
MESISAELRSIYILPYGSSQKLRLYKYVENPVFQPENIFKLSTFFFMQYRSAYIQ